MIPKENIKIGLKFIRRSGKKKINRLETLIDILKTYNINGDLVKVRYVSEHDFLGQKVTDKDIVLTTIQLSEQVI